METGVGVGVGIVLGGATIMDPLASPESLNHPNGQSGMMKVRMPATAPRNTIVLTTLANTDLGINRFIPSIPRVFRRPRKPTHTATRLLNLYLSPGIWVINDLNAEVPLSHLSINGYTAIIDAQASQVERNLRHREQFAVGVPNFLQLFACPGVVATAISARGNTRYSKES